MCFSINVFLLAFLHILGLIENVAVDVNQVKDIAKNMNAKMNEGFNKAEGKHI